MPPRGPSARHRGASAEAPENTLAAFERALALEVDGIELDVRLTRDGIPVVFHDARLTRLAGRRARLSTLTLAELHRARVGGEPIPTLEEVLRHTRNRALVQIEIKEGVPVAPVVGVVEAVGAERDVILASFARATVAAAREAAPAIPRMLIGRGGSSAALLSDLDALAAAGVSLDERAVRSAAFVAALRRRGRQLWCWTVNDAATMRRLAAWGVDAILSDNPALLKEICRTGGHPAR